jgi:hypothetical protein
MSEQMNLDGDVGTKSEADTAIQAALEAGLLNPETTLGTLLKLGADTKVGTLGYVAAWDRYALVVK